MQISRSEEGVYVHTQSGWFSDRSVRYLASGKPVLVQDTGFSRMYPTGEGLLAFDTLTEAVTGVGRIVGDYATHSQRAREIAVKFFDSSRVLGRLVETLGANP